MKNRILILFAHPMIHRSNVNKALINAISNLEGVTVHDLYSEYPDFFIDIEKEQDLLKKHDVIIFHYPMYWYSTPPILKAWQDLVLQYNFAYGEKGTAIAGKKFMNVITAGASKSTYEEEAINHFTIQELLRPIEQMASFTGMKYMPPFVIYGSHRILQSDIEEHCEEYKELLIRLREGDIKFDDTKKFSKFNELLSKFKLRGAS